MLSFSHYIWYRSNGIHTETNGKPYRMSNPIDTVTNGVSINTTTEEESVHKNERHYRQYKPKISTTGEDSCDSGDYFLSLSKDLKTMKTIPVSEL